MIKTIVDEKKIKDPWAMLALHVIRRAVLDARGGSREIRREARAWFQTADYRFYLDVVSVYTGLELPDDSMPEF